MPPSDSVSVNPCISCGACCAFYRISFYWAECDDLTPSGVPAAFTEKMDDFRLMMSGTGGISPRCLALEGVVGEKVGCRIYERRSSVCRGFAVAWGNGQPNPRCDKARAAWRLSLLAPLEPLAIPL